METAFIENIRLLFAFKMKKSFILMNLFFKKLSRGYIVSDEVKNMSSRFRKIIPKRYEGCICQAANVKRPFFTFLLQYNGTV